MDSLQKTAKEAFGAEAQQIIDKAIYAKMPDYVQKILSRAYLQDKPYNNLVLHLEREMRFNGLGTPDEVTLVLLYKLREAQTQKEHKPAKDRSKESKKEFCFHCKNFFTSRKNVGK